jgi:hypothetical protein
MNPQDFPVGLLAPITKQETIFGKTKIRKILARALSEWYYFLRIHRGIPFALWHYGNAALAQLVEQRTENPRVTGSSPVGGTSLSLRF